MVRSSVGPDPSSVVSGHINKTSLVKCVSISHVLRSSLPRDEVYVTESSVSRGGRRGPRGLGRNEGTSGVGVRRTERPKE